MRVLVVDDDQHIRTVVQLALDGMEVIEAASGPQALEMLAEEPVDLVLLDVMMPAMDGVEALWRIRVAPQMADVPVIILTAKAAERDHAEAFRAGADGYLTKPFDIDELEALVREVVARSAEERLALRNAEVDKAELLSQVERGFGGSSPAGRDIGNPPRIEDSANASR